MRSMLGLLWRAVLYAVPRIVFDLDSDWLLWFGLIFVAFVLFSPDGLVGIWARLSKRWWPAPEESAAMSRRKIYDGLPLPAFLMQKALSGIVLEVDGVSKSFGGIRAVNNASLRVGAARIHALIGREQTRDQIEQRGLAGAVRPISAWISPAPTLRLALLTARMPPKLFETPSTSSTMPESAFCIRKAGSGRPS